MLTDGLSKKQIEVVNSITDNVEIIACAGAGKTSVVTRRIVNILKQDSTIQPCNIVAFTFTKKAAEELKSRIYRLALDDLGHTNGFAEMYIGTIHGFCLQMLQENIPEFQNFSVLDEIHARLFAERYYSECGMEALNLTIYRETNLFIQAMSLLAENWRDNDKWDKNTRDVFSAYRTKMYEHKYFDYSLILYEMIEQLNRNASFRKVIKQRIKYLTVDEYQDTNPIQEELVSILHSYGANICIVGDDDQTIYQFRGSDADNILSFQKRYSIKDYIVLDTNYRSTSGIVDTAAHIIVNNSDRLPKKMNSGSSLVYDSGDIVHFSGDTLDDEAEFIAQRITDLHAVGVPYSEMAVLMRKKKIGGDIAAVFDKYDIPYIIEGVNALFSTKECIAAKSIFEYLQDDETGVTDLFERWSAIDYPIGRRQLSAAIQILASLDVKKLTFYPDFNIQKIFHDFLKEVDICEDGRPETEIILYNLGKFSQLIDDFEKINYTLSPKKKLRAFCGFLRYGAASSYPEGYLTNAYIKPDAVSIMTVHQAKGLEYTAVFIPQLNRNFFPAQRIGGKSIWSIIPRSWITNASRFDGNLEDERKLFYVAVTRAKKFLFFSRSGDALGKKRSEFWIEALEAPNVEKYQPTTYDPAHLPPAQKRTTELRLNFSLLEDYFECPYRFKLSVFYGFVQPIVEAMGYGNLMHAIVQRIHNAALNGESLSEKAVMKIIDSSFYLPYASSKRRANIYENVKRNILKYVSANASSFSRIVASEAKIEMDLGDGILVNGRIDMIQRTVGQDAKIVLTDFKTANKKVMESINTQQLRIYALGYQVLTGQTADLMQIYQLDTGGTATAEITPETLTNVAADIRTAAADIRSGNLPRRCEKARCKKCPLGHLCLNRLERKKYLTEV